MTSASRLHFCNWLREGLVGAIPIAGGIESQAARARFPITLSLSVEDGGSTRSEPVRLDLGLLGPGDVQGLDAAQIVRVEPKAGTGNFEPNYLAAVEFARADLPWMFSPLSANPDAGLTPWLTLIVVEADGAQIRPSRRQAPPVLTIEEPAGQLPDLGEAHYWAHVQLALDPEESVPGSADAVADAIVRQPEAARSRLVCPRRLSPDTDYVAALVPTFAVGVQAGLGRTPAEDASLGFAWPASPPSNLALPVYFSWTFSTGRAGDFETLVRRLVPRMPLARLGVRAMAIDRPGYGLDVDAPSRLDFESALTTPAFTRAPWRERARRETLAELLNTRTRDGEPVVGPPIYGQWHALRDTVGSDRGWLDELNLDPRHRGAAGLGAETVRRHQDTLMHEAWRQVGQVEAANRLLRLAQAAREINRHIHRDRLARFEPSRLLGVTRPLHARVTLGRVTVTTRLGRSPLPAGTLDRTLRRLVAPRGALVRRALRVRELAALEPGRSPLPRLADGRLALAIDGAPEGFDTIGTLATRVLPKTPLDRRDRAALAAEIREGLPSLRPRAVARLEPARPVRVVRASASLDELELENDPEDADGRAFRDAAVRTLGGLFELESTPDEKPAPGFEVPTLARELLVELDPEVTVVRRTLERLRFPPRPRNDPIRPIMAAPEFLGAMNEALSALSPDHLLGNVRELRPDTITLLANNAEFVEAYLVGLNHEMARELLWRGYPTDQRGSYFRGFWRAIPIEADEAERERRRDIPPIHTWRSSSRLGSHLRIGDDQLVLLIRGELLRRYPRTLVSAVRAEWTEGEGEQLADVRRNGGEVRGNRFRRPVANDRPGFEERLPRFVATLPPDITLLGFELTEDAARGAIDAAGRPDPDGDAGWFFVLKEPPSGTRFGFDDAGGNVGPLPGSVADLDWRHVLEPDARGSWRVDASRIALNRRFDDGESGADRDLLFWGRNAAHMAAIALQKPVLVAIHADDMLPRADGA